MGDKDKMQTCNSEEKEVWITRFYIKSVRDDFFFFLMVKTQASIWVNPLRPVCLLPVLTSCLIPSTDTVALARRFPSTSLTTPLTPRCTCGSHDQHFLRLCHCFTIFIFSGIETLHPSTFWLWVSATVPHRDLICMFYNLLNESQQSLAVVFPLRWQFALVRKLVAPKKDGNLKAVGVQVAEVIHA